MVEYEWLWIAVCVLVAINFLFFVCLGWIMYRLGKAERLLFTFMTDPDYYDTVMDDMTDERRRRDEEWRRQRDIPDIPMKINEFLGKVR